MQKQSFLENKHGDMPIIMGILNITPDSFSDGGKFFSHDKAIEHALNMIKDGANIIDIGGESTRPFANPISPAEEISRICPVIKVLSEELKTQNNKDVIISIDTRHTKTMESAIKSGATMINDVNALQDTGAVSLVAEANIPVCLMHMQKTPNNMQLSPFYGDVISEIMDFLKRRVEICINSGIDKSNIIIDPGIGFGKTLNHNLTIMNNIRKFKELALPVMIGSSNKSFIEKICPDTPCDQRIGGSLASVLWAYMQGINIFRVHDVKQTVQALSVLRAIRGDSHE